VEVKEEEAEIRVAYLQGLVYRDKEILYIEMLFLLSWAELVLITVTLI
jgi:hypothetical protein